MNSYGLGGEKICDEKEETKIFNEAKKEEIAGTLEEKEFVTQK